ncbi:hypothetical protein BMASAVP1_A0252 [Burkholderia mallei SAVP1]|nr:hypothetical protein BMASAVP1_A0252 [Burkholderia mallei SAVP1]
MGFVSSLSPNQRFGLFFVQCKLGRPAKRVSRAQRAPGCGG